MSEHGVRLPRWVDAEAAERLTYFSHVGDGDGATPAVQARLEGAVDSDAKCNTPADLISARLFRTLRSVAMQFYSHRAEAAISPATAIWAPLMPAFADRLAGNRPSASSRTASPRRILTKEANRCGDVTAKLVGCRRQSRPIGETPRPRMPRARRRGGAFRSDVDASALTEHLDRERLQRIQATLARPADAIEIVVWTAPLQRDDRHARRGRVYAEPPAMGALATRRAARSAMPCHHNLESYLHVTPTRRSRRDSGFLSDVIL